jgi:hypothetical protein
MNSRLIAPLAAFALCALAPVQSPAQTADWRTPAEIANYRTTPDYAESVAYIERIAAAYPKLAH